MAPVPGSQAEILMSIGWDEESWKLHPSCVDGGDEPKFINKRLDNSDKLTNNVVFILLNKIVNVALLFKIISYLLPTGIFPSSYDCIHWRWVNPPSTVQQKSTVHRPPTTVHRPPSNIRNPPSNKKICGPETRDQRPRKKRKEVSNI